MAEKEGEDVSEADICISEPVEDLNKLVESLPEGEKREQVRRLVGKIESRSFSSPVPPPEFMAGYVAIIPDSPDRILIMAEKGQQADIIARDKLIAGQNRFHKYNFIRDIFWGCIFLLIFLAVLGAGIFLILSGYKEEGRALLGGGGIISLLFLGLSAYFKRNERPEEKKK